MIVIKVNYTTDQPIIKVNYDDAPIYISTTVDATYIKVDYGTGGGAGGTIWGDIIGTLSDQLDLQAALDAKVPYTGATGDVDLGEYELKAGQIELDQSPTGTAGVAVTRWNDTIGSTETTLKGGNVVLKNGVDLVARVVNKVTPNTTLTKAAYQAVKVSGAQGQRLAIALAQANNDNNSADTLGIVTETIPTNQEGFIMTVGNLEGINTTGSLQGETWTDGDVLYLSPTTAGAITNIKPNGSTGHIVVIGYVEYAHQNNGKIYVKIMNGWELDELHNVFISSPANNDALIYESATSLWKNKSIATALGYTPGTVSSVALSVPTGLVITSGSPITTSGTIAVGLQSGYSIPTTVKQSNWDDAYTFVSAFPTQSGNSGKYLTTDGSTLSWGTVSTANIYNSDGTLTGDRTVTLGSNNLTFLKTIAAVTNAEGIDIKNDTVSTVTNNSYSPSLTFSGFGWGNTSANTLSRIRQYLVPVSGSPWNQPTLRWDGWNTSDWTNLMTLKSFAFGGGSPYGGLSVGSINVNTTQNQIDNNNSSSQLVFVNANGNGGIKLQGWNQYILMNSSVGISFHNGTNEMGRFYTATGNLRIQTGGVFADDNYKLDVQGTGRFTQGLYLTGPYTSFNYLSIGTGTGNAIFYWSSYRLSIGGVKLISEGIVGDPTGLATTTRASSAIDSKGYLVTDSIGIGTDTSAINSSAIAQINSTTKGFLQPRMTGTERDAIVSPATGLSVYNTTTNTSDFYNGTSWVSLANGNIYTADGTLTGDRTVTNNAFTLSIINSSNTSAALILKNNNVYGTGSVFTQYTQQWLKSNGTNAGYVIGDIGRLVMANMVQAPELSVGSVAGIIDAGTSRGGSIGVNGSPIDFGTATYAGGGTNIGRWYSTGNLRIQTGGIFADDGFKLDVQGTGRVTGQMTIGSLRISGWEGTAAVSFTANGGGNALQTTFQSSFSFGPAAGTNANSTFIGYAAGQGATNAINSNFLGNTAGNAATNASYSNLFGFQAGRTFTANNIGSNNIIIGTNISLPNGTANSINLGGIIFAVNTYSTTTGDPSIIAQTSGRVSIGTNLANASAILDLTSTTLGFLQPRMTTTQRDAISTPATGLSVYNTTTNTSDFYNGTSWVSLAAGNIYTADGTLTGNRTVTLGGNTLSFTGDIRINNINVGRGNSSVLENTAFGNIALNVNTTGNANTAIGYESLKLNTTASSNTAIGYRALWSNIIGGSNTAIGSDAGLFNTSSDNTFVGTGSGRAVTNSQNSAFGSGSMRNATTGSSNAAFGYNSLPANVTGNQNSGFGSFSLQTLTSGIQNTGIGSQSLAATSIVSNNTGVGFQSLYDATGGNNTSLGSRSGFGITTGTNNIIIGYYATGSGLTTGSNNTIIGSTISGLTSNLANHIILADGDGNMRLAINGSGDTVLGGTTTLPTFLGYKLDVQGTGRFTGNVTTAAGKITLGEGTFNDPVINFTAASKTSFIGVVQSAGAFITAGTVGDNFIRSQDNARYFYFGSGSGGASFFRFSYSDASIIIDGNGTGTSFTTIPSSQLTVNSTTRGFLPPRMTETQKNAISTPATGLIVYQTDGTEGLYERTSSAWRLINASGSGGSGITRSVNNISTTTTAGAAASTDYVYLISGTTTLTLPTAAGNTNRYTLKNVGTNTVTINTTSSQTIDGSTSITMAVQYTALDVISDGTNWNII